MLNSNIIKLSTQEVIYNEGTNIFNAKFSYFLFFIIWVSITGNFNLNNPDTKYFLLFSDLIKIFKIIFWKNYCFKIFDCLVNIWFVMFEKSFAQMKMRKIRLRFDTFFQVTLFSFLIPNAFYFFVTLFHCLILKLF